MEQDKWRDLAYTGPGTPAGEYMRSFWQPVLRSQDLPQERPIPIRILSEDFVLYRGASGKTYMMEPRCAHRRTLLHLGWVEEDALRCRYHGWKYDGTGQCIEQPGERESFAERVKLQSYPTEEYLGHIWAYLRKGEAPPIRRFLDLDREGLLIAGKPEEWPCNYFNRVDNACDSAHVAFTHRASVERGVHIPLKIGDYPRRETEYGIADLDRENPSLYFTAFHMPNTNQLGGYTRVEGGMEDYRRFWVDRLNIRVPVDDEHHVGFWINRIAISANETDQYLRRREEYYRERKELPRHEDIGSLVVAGKMRIEDITESDIDPYWWFPIDDYAVQVGQGPIADRANERLGEVDQGVILLRSIWLREMRLLAMGKPVKSWRQTKIIGPDPQPSPRH